MAKDPSISPMNADRPIESIGDDLLSRASFCTSLANAIQHWNGKESLVLGVYGPWGSGKTSVKNIVLDLLKKKEHPLSVIEFNPWAWSGEDRLQTAFFDEIGDALSGVNVKGANPEALSKKWRRYATRMSLGGSALMHLKTAAEFAAIPWAPMILEGVSKAINEAGSVGAQAADAHEAIDYKKNAEELKKELADELSNLEKPILVVIDDIDRLTTDEIRLLFRTVKANAAFPNLVFMLLFDRAVIENSLDGTSGNLGREYMEKIVQVGFDIPRLQQGELNEILIRELKELIKFDSSQINFDSDRWPMLYLQGIQPFFGSLRHVRRFLSSFSFHLRLFLEKDTLEVDIVDLISIEIIRVFEPDLYHALADNPHIVFGKNTFVFSEIKEDKNKDHRKDIINNWLLKASEKNRDSCSNIARQIFPQIDGALKGHAQGMGFEASWLKKLRICHPVIFDRYFSMRIPEGDVPQSRVNELLSLTHDKEALKAKIQSLESPEKISETLNRLEVHASGISLNHAQEMIHAIFELGEDFPPESPDPFSLSSARYCSTILREILLQENEPAKRGELVLDCLADTKAIWMPLQLISLEQPEPYGDRCENRGIFDEPTFEKAIEWGLKTIRSAAKSDAIVGPRLGFFLRRWKRWSAEKEPKTWANNYIGKSHSNALNFIVHMVRQMAVPPEQGASNHFFFSIEKIEPFVNIVLLRKQLEPYLQDHPEAHNLEAVSTHKEIIEAARTMFLNWGNSGPSEIEEPADPLREPLEKKEKLNDETSKHWEKIRSQLNLPTPRDS